MDNWFEQDCSGSASTANDGGSEPDHVAVRDGGECGDGLDRRPDGPLEGASTANRAGLEGVRPRPRVTVASFEAIDQCESTFPPQGGQWEEAEC